jgi:hypothetical protein
VSVTGVLGSAWRADVTTWGDVVPWDGSPALAWYVAADDRWHRPADETTVRQHRPHGAAVFETRVRVPGGDVVQRVWSVPDCTAVEVTNDSPLPVACAFTRSDLVTARPPTDVPIQGIELPAGSIVVPIGHRATVRVALPHRAGGVPGALGAVPAADVVAKGWLASTERASRIVVPDEHAVADVVAARCDALLVGPPEVADDAVGFLLTAHELARMGEPAAAVEDVADAVHAIARRNGWAVDAALDAAAALLARLDERRAGRDLARLVAGRVAGAPPSTSSGIATVAALERRLARGPALLPDGIPDAWRGASLEAHGVPAGPVSTVSFAVRWHGDRPAVLWEVSGEPVELCAPAVAPAWRSSAPAGEALWPPQAGSTSATRR